MAQASLGLGRVRALAMGDPRGAVAILETAAKLFGDVDNRMGVGDASCRSATRRAGGGTASPPTPSSWPPIATPRSSCVHSVGVWDHAALAALVESGSHPDREHRGWLGSEGGMTCGS
jgi:hypothetical protein